MIKHDEEYWQDFKNVQNQLTLAQYMMECIRGMVKNLPLLRGARRS